MTSAEPVAGPGHAGAPRRRWRWRIALICLLVIVATPVIGYFYLRWIQDRELQAAIAEIEAVDPRWRFQDVLADRPPIADAHNTGLVVAKVELLLQPSGYDIGVKNWSELNDLFPVHQLNGPPDRSAADRPGQTCRCPDAGADVEGFHRGRPHRHQIQQ